MEAEKERWEKIRRVDYYPILRVGRNRNLGISIAPLRPKRTRTPAYSETLRQIKGVYVVQRIVHGIR